MWSNQVGNDAGKLVNNYRFIYRKNYSKMEKMNAIEKVTQGLMTSTQFLIY